MRTLIYDPPLTSARFTTIMPILPPVQLESLFKRIPDVLPDKLDGDDGWRLNGELILDETADTFFLGHIAQEFPIIMADGNDLFYTNGNIRTLIDCIVGLLYKLAAEQETT